MKTLMLWQCEMLTGDAEFPSFLELEGNYMHLNGVYINAVNLNNNERELSPEKCQELQEELGAIIFNEDGSYKVNFLKEPTKDWDFFIHSGFLP